MRLSFIAFLFLSYLSCRKEEPRIDITEFFYKYLTCDSIISIADGVETVKIKGRNTGSDLKIDAKNYTIYSSPLQELSYTIRKSRIYYWKKNVDQHQGDFMKIKSKEGKHLVLEHKDIVSKKIERYYYTSE